MIKEWATVVSWDNGQALLKCDVKTSCSSCSSRVSCGTRVLNKLGPQSEHLLVVPSDKPLKAGQKVELGIAEKSLLSSAFLVYMLPLIGLFLVAGIFQFIFSDDMASMLGALIGGFAGFIVARQLSHRLSDDKDWQPVILTVALGSDELRIESVSAE